MNGRPKRNRALDHVYHARAGATARARRLRDTAG